MSPTDLLDPATEEVVATVDMADLAGIDVAIATASAASSAWREVRPADRARLLRRLAVVIDDHHEELAELERRNAGHPISSARGEIALVRDVFEYYGGAPERHTGRQIPVSGGVALTFYEPIGVVGVIAPWNFPLPITSWGVAPALAAGNTVVVKPAPTTPLTALRLAELALEAGFPHGVLSVVPGDGPTIGHRLVSHEAVRKICFTGSTAVGKEVMVGCAEEVKRLTLELGGKSATLVFADADLERAAAAAPYAVFDNAGQDCCARSRLLVEDTIYDRFLELLEPAVRAVVVGDTANELTEMGPLITAAHRDRVSEYLEGATVAFTGSCPRGPGFWFAPTVLLSGPTRSHRSDREEVFGPVVSVTRFSGEAEAVAIANETPYGLSGSIWTSDVGRALRVARAVESGALSVNSNSSVRYGTPFGGFKQSGLGRELGPDALLGFSEEKTVFISTEGP